MWPVPAPSQATEVFDEARKAWVAEFAQTLGMRLGVSANLIGADAPLFGSDFFAMSRDVEPSFDHRRVDLEMELEPIGVCSEAKRLVRTRRGRREVDRAFRDLERVAVPLKDFFARFEVGE